MLKDLILEDCEFRGGSSIQIFMSLLDFSPQRHGLVV
jgi:hypothetical protein